MITKEYLEKTGFESEDINLIIKYSEKYKDKIEPLVLEYVSSGIKKNPSTPYAEGERDASLNRAVTFSKSVQDALPDVNEYVARLIGWLNCMPYIHQIYKKMDLSDELFFESMKDFLYKSRECKNVYGVCGLFVDWDFLFFDMQAFSLGRLQYEVATLMFDDYSCGNINLKEGDTVYSCHIPSSGKLTTDMCMESFQKAYEFFFPKLKGNVIPIVCYSWLLYKPYIGDVFEEGTNMERFARLFDIYKTFSTGNTFHDSWRVFGKDYEGSLEGLPSDNTLRRNFIKYIENGGDFGSGYGIILYDGEKREIINIC